jgi:hypothetical protein
MKSALTWRGSQLECGGRSNARSTQLSKLTRYRSLRRCRGRSTPAPAPLPARTGWACVVSGGSCCSWIAGVRCRSGEISGSGELAAGRCRTLTPHPNEPISFYGCWPLPFLKGPGLDAASLLNLCGSRCSMSGHGTTGVPPSHQRRFTLRTCRRQVRRAARHKLDRRGG